jgi:hypothetical protein
MLVLFRQDTDSGFDEVTARRFAEATRDLFYNNRLTELLVVVNTRCGRLRLIRHHSYAESEAPAQ